MRIVIALGGNALLQRGEAQEAHIQQQHVQTAACAIATIAETHEILLCHGNGPQIGLLALQNLAYPTVSPYPFDILGAESQGMIGYLLQQAIKNVLPHRAVSSLLTQVTVDPNDPAFQSPEKFIGPVYDKDQAQQLAAQYRWTIKADGQHYRRVVPSPKPKAIIEQAAIETLLSAQHIVIAGGGGGIPVIAENDRLIGVEAVIDKDRTAGLLAKNLRADALIILTDVEAVFAGFQTPAQKAIQTLQVSAVNEQDFAAGSMGPKVSAACDFVRAGGQFAAIGHLAALADIVSGKRGTRFS